MSINLARLFMVREALASCRIEGIEARLEDVLVEMIRDDERQRRRARKREREMKRRHSPRSS